VEKQATIVDMHLVYSTKIIVDR